MSERLKKYIEKQKKQGKKRVSFFVDEKFWNYLTKRAKKDNLTIPEYLKKSFNLKRIDDHQAEALTAIISLLPSSNVWVVYGVHVARGDTRLYVFDWKYLNHRYIQQKNILKKR